MYHRNIFGSSLIVFGNLQKSSDIFGNFQKFSENVRERLSGLWNNFGKSSEIFGKWSEIFGKSPKTPSSVFLLYNKKNSTRWLYVLAARTISHSFAALTCEILFLPLKHKIHIFSPPCNILYFFLYLEPHPILNLRNYGKQDSS